MADVHEQMEDGGCKGGEEDSHRRHYWFRLSTPSQEEQEEEDRGEKTKEKSGEQGMTIGAVKGKEGGRAEISTQQVNVSDGSGDEHGSRSGAREPGKRGALESVGGQGMGEGIHGKSYLIKTDVSSASPW